MTHHESPWSETIVECMALAARLEGEGQYNIAKLLRASVDSLLRQAAYEIETPGERKLLSERVQRAAGWLSHHALDATVGAALQRGADALAAGRLPLIKETPNPYVCRTCGRISLGPPQDKCPRCSAWAATYQLFPPVYWLNAYEPYAALDRLTQTPEDVAGLLAGLSEEQLNQRPADGGWAIRHTLTHLRDAQGVISYRVDLFIANENPLLESQAVFAWAGNPEGKPPETREIYEDYRSSRAEMVEKLRKIPLSHWFRIGQHEEFGSVTLRQQVSYFAAHEMTHLPQIELLRRGFLQ